MTWLLFASLIAAAPLDGRGHPVKDDLLEQLAGRWKLTGTAAGRPAHNDVVAEWVLGHQFLRIRFENGPYQAHVYFGYDNLSDRYVAHWLDEFGGRFSETLGYGHRKGDEIALLFEYPDGPFHTTFRREGAGWRILMEQRDASGAWKPFANQVLQKQ
jgi:hypothetical protein